MSAHVYCASLKHQNDFRATFSIAVSTLKHSVSISDHQKGRLPQLKRNRNEFSLGLHAELLDQIHIKMATLFPLLQYCSAQNKGPSH
jgi:hypothetical protein